MPGNSILDKLEAGNSKRYNLTNGDGDWSWYTYTGFDADSIQSMVCINLSNLHLSHTIPAAFRHLFHFSYKFYNMQSD